MNPDIVAYHLQLEPEHRMLCEYLAQEFSRSLPESEAKVWHAHPVWFIDGNPIVGYHRSNRASACCFGADNRLTSRC